MAKRRGLPKSIHSGIPRLPAQTPTGWDRVPLYEGLQEIRRPATLKPETSYRLVTVKRSRQGVEERGWLLGKEIKTKTQFYVSAGDFLISKRQIVHGACGLVPLELDGSVVSNEYAIVKSRGRLDLTYLSYLSQSLYFQQTCFHSSIGVHIEKMIFKLDQWLRWEYDLPPLPEQQKIARFLSTWDKAIAAVEKLIENSKAQKKALMQQLLTGKQRLPGFTEEWQEVVLGSLGATYGGLSGKSKEDFGRGKPFIPYINIFNNSKIDIAHFDLVDIAPTERQSRVRYGDIFFTTSSETPEEVGMSSVLLDQVPDLYLNSFCFGFRLHNFDILSPEYARYVLRSEQIRRAITVLAQGSTRFNLSKQELMKLRLKLPCLDEQNAITVVLVNAERQVNTLEQQRLSLQEQKTALMQQLLTGKRRVQVDHEVGACESGGDMTRKHECQRASGERPKREKGK